MIFFLQQKWNWILLKLKYFAFIKTIIFPFLILFLLHFSYFIKVVLVSAAQQSESAPMIFLNWSFQGKTEVLQNLWIQWVERFPILNSVSNEISDTKQMWFFFYILYKELCQLWKDLHNSVSQSFPNDQHMMLKSLAWVKRMDLNVRSLNVTEEKSTFVWFQIPHCN